MPKSSTAMRTPRSLMAWRRRAVSSAVAHQRGLGDLDDQGVGLEAAVVECVADVVDDGVVVELAAGDVDRDVEGVAGGVPHGHLLSTRGRAPSVRRRGSARSVRGSG